MHRPLVTLHDFGTAIDAHAAWLGRAAVDVAHEALSAHDERNYVLAVNRAGVFLEGLLRRMIEESAATPAAPLRTLGHVIGAVRESGLPGAKPLADLRLGAANTIRIRSAHDKQEGSDDAFLDAITPGDSLQMLEIVALTVEWCGRGRAPAAQAADGQLPIFLSVGGSHRLDQLQFVERLRHEMRQQRVELRSLSKEVYSPGRPFEQIAKLLGSCRAALVVGLDRSHAYAVFEREKSKDQKIYPEQYVPTPWNQIEGGMASALGLRVLILREVRLHPEGIFEAKSHRHDIYDFDLQTEAKGLSGELRRFLAGWVSDLRADVAAAPSAKDHSQ